jgi:hypothetical protein
MSEIELKFEKRLASAQRYYIFKNNSTNKNWIDIFFEIESSPTFGIPEVLVLLDPSYYSGLGSVDPRGGRTFPLAQKFSKCRSVEIWGYECPFQGKSVHIDHTFPHSKGGVTHFENAMYLCEEHNRAKSTDIHLIPWETMVKANSWIESALQILILSASRLSDKKLHLPEKQLNRI